MSEMKFKLDWIALNVDAMAIQSLFTICKSSDLMWHDSYVDPTFNESYDMGHFGIRREISNFTQNQLLLIINKII